jgi:hypothetical protein
MQAATPLLRQVHPTWVKDDGNAASIAFWPFPKDEGLLSVDDGDRATPEASWRRFVAKPDCASAGVWAFTVGEAAAIELPAQDNPLPDNAEHVLVDFRAFQEKQQKAKAKLLSKPANERGCLFAAPT